ncbi:MAG: cell division protein FtsQ/DivIB, partial [Burkholderiales bacterium]|nr:cell division protein FtsQ/DivIB [Burkholderiales bacterium]
EQARAAFEKLPWVRVAHVRRVWPDRLQVTLEEHVPLARWHGHGLVNIHGEVFDAATELVLPVLAGPEGSAAEMTRNFVRFRDLLATVDRAPVEIRLSVRGAWQITLDDGQILELGRQDLLPRLTRFIAAYRTVITHVPPGGRIDLRYANGFAVRQPGLRWRERPV